MPRRKRATRRRGPTTSFRTGTRLHDEPLIHVFDDFLTPAECAHLRTLGEPGQTRAVVSSGNQGVTSTGRTNGVAWVPHKASPTSHRIALRISQLVGLPLVHAESFQVIHYAQTQEYRPHFDAYDPSTERGKRCCARGGQRLVTVLAYLNDVAQGGGTVLEGRTA